MGATLEGTNVIIPPFFLLCLLILILIRRLIPLLFSAAMTRGWLVVYVGR